MNLSLSRLLTITLLLILYTKELLLINDTLVIILIYPIMFYCLISYFSTTMNERLITDSNTVSNKGAEFAAFRENTVQSLLIDLKDLINVIYEYKEVENYVSLQIVAVSEEEILGDSFTNIYLVENQVGYDQYYAYDSMDFSWIYYLAITIVLL